MKTLHFECHAGISGDMTLGALVDLGVDPDYLRGELQKLGVQGWSLDFVKDQRNGISGTRAIVEDLSHHDHHEHQEHDHEHDFEHHHRGPHDHGHQHHAHDEHQEHDHEHDFEHHHREQHEHHAHSHNSWREIRALIEASGVKAGAKRRALDIFSRIAVAEAQVHGKAVEDVAFHEVGALDSIIDIVGAAICLDALAPDRITSSEIELGGGTVRCAHGELQVPAPATLLLCAGLPVKTGGFNKEMTTPTGAAILAASVDEFVSRASFVERTTGYGIGMRKLDKPNVLRVSWREESSGLKTDDKPWLVEELVLMEANVDDMTGEALGFLMERLFDSGALDVTFTGCVMKKGRPGTIVSTLCAPAHLDDLRKTLFLHSSTLGFRESEVRRLSLRRQEERIQGDFGSARKKLAYWENRELKAKIDYEDRARVARELGLTLDQATTHIEAAEEER